MRQITLLACLALLSLPLLQGYNSNPPPRVIEYPRPAIPSPLLSRQDQPIPPALKDDKALANYILDLASAGQNCRSHLQAVRSILQ